MISTRSTSQDSLLKKRVGRCSPVLTTGPPSGPSTPNLVLTTCATSNATPGKPNLASTTLDEDLVKTNPYIAFVAKRIRTLRKRVARIETTESILTSDPGARDKMEPAQLDAVARKLDAVAPLRELEELMKLMKVHHATDTKAEAADQHKRQLEVKKRSMDHHMPVNTSAACFIQLVKLFYVLKQLEDAAEFLDNDLLKSLHVLDTFRSKLFLAAEVAELGEDQGSHQWLHDMVMGMVNRSSKPISDDDPRTFCEVITELDNIVYPKTVGESRGSAVLQSDVRQSNPTFDGHAFRDVENWSTDHQKRSVEDSVSIRQPLAMPEGSPQLPHAVVMNGSPSLQDAMEGAQSDALKYYSDEDQQNRGFVRQEWHRSGGPVSENKHAVLTGSPNRSNTAMVAPFPSRSVTLDGSSETNPTVRRTGRQRRQTSRYLARTGGVPVPLLQLQYSHTPQHLLPPLSTHTPQQQQQQQQQQQHPFSDIAMLQQGAGYLHSEWMDQQQQHQQHRPNHYGHVRPYHHSLHPGQQPLLQQPHQFYQPHPFYFGYHPGFDPAYPHGIGFDSATDVGEWAEPTKTHPGQEEEEAGSQPRSYGSTSRGGGKGGKGSKEHGTSKYEHNPKSDL